MRADLLSNLHPDARTYALQVAKQHKINGCVEGCNHNEYIRDCARRRHHGIKDAEFHSTWDTLRDRRVKLSHDEYTAELDRMLDLLNERDFA